MSCNDFRYKHFQKNLICLKNGSVSQRSLRVRLALRCSFVVDLSGKIAFLSLISKKFFFYETFNKPPRLQMPYDTACVSQRFVITQYAQTWVQIPPEPHSLVFFLLIFFVLFFCLSFHFRQRTKEQFTHRLRLREKHLRAADTYICRHIDISINQSINCCFAQIPRHKVITCPKIHRAFRTRTRARKRQHPNNSIWRQTQDLINKFISAANFGSYVCDFSN